jgi:ADP-ribosyl-[dinitrogen reductase] hydrolase
MIPRNNALTRSILGTALGDSLGLPFEGMSRRRVQRSLPVGGLSHRFLFGRGMVSDDTEHTCLVAHALAASRGDVAQFEQLFASYLRWWLLGLPAGVGLATLRAIVRLWLGFGPHRSGVASAGNGPAMRAAIIGAYAADKPNQRDQLVRVSTRLTHTDSRAEHGALAVAHAAALSARQASGSPAQLIREVRQGLDDGEMARLLETAEQFADRPSRDLADQLQLQRGVSGFVNHTVPICVHVWARHQHALPAALDEVIRLGGDTDTTAAIVGGMLGASSVPQGIMSEWLDGILEWPRSVHWMEELGHSLATGMEPPGLRWPATFLRNALFTLGVYVLILRRALPPY